MCKRNDVPCQALTVAVKQSRQEVIEGVVAVLCDPLYDTQKLAVSAHPEYDWLILKTFAVLVDVLSVLMDLGVPGHIFYYVVR